MNKIRDVAVNYEKFNADEKACVPDINYVFAKQFVFGLPEHLLANAVKDTQPKK